MKRIMIGFVAMCVVFGFSALSFGQKAAVKDASFSRNTKAPVAATPAAKTASEILSTAVPPHPIPLT